MTAWWDKIAGAADEDRETPKTVPRLGPSIYENRGSAAPETVIVATSGPRVGRVVGYEVDGTFVKAGPCCADPRVCEREECWTPLTPNLDGFRDVR
jgi:hypothetical protein